MIVAHCFLREIRKGTWYLMCETSVTEGMNPPFPKPDVMFQVELDEDRSEWVSRVKDRILAMRPDLEYIHTLKPKRPEAGRPASFDLAFRTKDDTGKSKGFVAKLMKGMTK